MFQSHEVGYFVSSLARVLLVYKLVYDEVLEKGFTKPYFNSVSKLGYKEPHRDNTEVCLRLGLFCFTIMLALSIIITLSIICS